MSARASQSQHTEQRLQMSQSMKQSLDILQMPLTELREYILDAALSNPLLKVENAGGITSSYAPLPSDHANEVQIRATFRGDSMKELFTSRTTDGDAAMPEAVYHQFDDSDFTEYLNEQLLSRKLSSPSLRSACRFLILSLNSRGYLEERLEDLIRSTTIPKPEAEEALQILQSLQPAGVAARDLKECLRLQLERSGRDSDPLTPLALRAAEEGLELIAAEDISALSRLLGCTRKEARAVSERIRSLNPIPSQGFGSKVQTVYQIPEAVITAEGGTVSVEFNRSFLPGISYDTEIASLLKEAKTAGDDKSAAYLKSNGKDAEQLIRFVEARESTMEQLIFLIVREQKDYFLTGAPLRPMTMSEAAERLSVNVSTVSRTVHDKTIQFRGRILPLKRFFSTALPTAKGGNVVSSDGVKQAMRQLIEKEDPKKPLTDSELSLILSSMGMPVSRRTVAKYRDAMGIEGSVKRGAKV